MQCALDPFDEVPHVVERQTGPAARRDARPRRSVSFTTSRNALPVRRVSLFSLAATSSSRVRVVLITMMLVLMHHDVNLKAS